MLSVWSELDDEIGRTGAVSEALNDRVWAAMEAHEDSSWAEDLARLAAVSDRTLAMVVSIATRVGGGAATSLALAAWARLVGRIAAAAPYSDASWSVLDPFVESALVQTAFAPFEWAAADDFSGSALALSGEDPVAAAIAMWALSDRPTRPLSETLLKDVRRWRDSAIAPACFVAGRLV